MGTGIYLGMRERGGTGGYCRVLVVLCGPGVWGYLGVIECSGGYSGVLWGTVLYCGGTAWYCWLLLVIFGYWVVLGGTGWYWGALKCIGWLLGVLWSTVGYCRVLLGTVGFCQALHGTTGYSGGTRCILGKGGVLGELWDTARYCGYWGYCGVLRG